MNKSILSLALLALMLVKSSAFTPMTTAFLAAPLAKLPFVGRVQQTQPQDSPKQQSLDDFNANAMRIIAEEHSRYRVYVRALSSQER